jgi:hypothetical protein
VWLARACFGWISRFTNTYVLTVNRGYEHVAGDALMGAQQRLFDDERLAASSADEGRFSCVHSLFGLLMMSTDA